MVIFLGTKTLDVGRKDPLEGVEPKDGRKLHVSHSVNRASLSRVSLSQELLRYESHQINLFT